MNNDRILLGQCLLKVQKSIISLKTDSLCRLLILIIKKHCIRTCTLQKFLKSTHLPNGSATKTVLGFNDGNHENDLTTAATEIK